MAPKKQYTKEQMDAALEAVQRGVNVHAASKQFNVPRVTLLYKSSGKLPKDCTMGPTTVLTKEEEVALVKWILKLSEHHYPISKVQLLDSVEYIMKETKRENKFTNNRPGNKWYNLFLKRHPELAERVSQNLTASRESVTEAAIRSWFEEIKNYLDAENLFDITVNHPERVFNADEAAFYMQPKGEKVLAKKGNKNVYTASKNDEKENLTVLVTASAAGRFAPPMIVFSYERIPSHISSSVPAEWGIGRSESGWMCGATFFEYIANVFLPWLVKNGIERLVLFFVDGHVSHMTLHLSKFCSANGIILLVLYPNSTHLIQPLDVAVFRALKNFWKKEVTNWRMENCGNKLQKYHFAPIFKKALESISEETIINGFRACGLTPFNVENVKFNKIAPGKLLNTPSLPNHKPSESTKNMFLKELENRIGEEKVRTFQSSMNENDWDGAIEDRSLFKIWKSAVLETPKTIASMPKDIPDTILTGDDDNNIILTNKSSTDKENQTPEPIPLKEQLERTPLKNNQRKSTEQLQIDIMQPSTSKSTNNLKTNLQVDPVFDVPENVSTPFKRALIGLWPENINSQQTKKRKSKEKIPSAVTSAAWQEYNIRKENEKNRKKQEREERIRNRKKKKAEKNKLKEIEREESSEDEESWIESGDSMDDVSIDIDNEDPDFCDVIKITNSKNIQVGDYLLVNFPGGKRNTTLYRYVCVVQNIFLSDQKVEVLCMKVLDPEKMVFKADESDVSTVPFKAIIGKLPPPELLMVGDRMKYNFPGPVNIFESA